MLVERVIVKKIYFWYSAERKKYAANGNDTHVQLSRLGYWSQFSGRGCETIINVVQYLNSILASTASIERSFHGYSLCLTVVRNHNFCVTIYSALLRQECYFLCQLGKEFEWFLQFFLFHFQLSKGRESASTTFLKHFIRMCASHFGTPDTVFRNCKLI